MTCRTSRSADGCADRRGGFTLVELLLVVCVMSLALGLSLPRIGAVKADYLAAEEARGVEGLIRAARADAVALRTTVGVAVAEGAAGVLELRRMPGRTWNVDEAALPTAEGVGGPEVWSAEVVRTAEVGGRLRVVADGRGILFFANGASTGGVVMVLDEDGGMRRRFRIDAETGGLTAQPGSDP